MELVDEIPNLSDSLTLDRLERLECNSPLCRLAIKEYRHFLNEVCPHKVFIGHLIGTEKHTWWTVVAHGTSEAVWMSYDGLYGQIKTSNIVPLLDWIAQVHAYEHE